MAGGRPRKRQRNTSGLINQPRNRQFSRQTLSDTDPVITGTAAQAVQSISITEEEMSKKILDECWVRDESTGFTYWFGYQADSEREDSDGEDFEGDEDLGDESDGEGRLVDENWDEEEYENEFLQERLIAQATAMDEDVNDEDWIPEELKRKRRRKERRQQREKKDRPKTYSIGPVISLKAERTRRRYKSSVQGQVNLQEFGFSGGAIINHGFVSMESPNSSPSTSSPSSEIDESDIEVIEPASEIFVIREGSELAESSMPARTESEPSSPEAATADLGHDSDLDGDSGEEEINELDDEDLGGETWQEELERTRPAYDGADIQYSQSTQPISI
ncbi:hypothetical protein K435DRAFT_912455, partial [Dendrothele bispora CBS 962.96]